MPTRALWGDAVIVCSVTFGQAAEDCGDAIDNDQDGFVDCNDTDCCFEQQCAALAQNIGITDAIFLLQFLFLHGPEPPPPFASCERDPTRDALDCFVNCSVEPSVHLRHKPRKAERCPGAGSAGDRRQEFRAARRPVGRRAGKHGPSAIGFLSGHQKLDPSPDLGALCCETRERQSI